MRNFIFVTEGAHDVSFIGKLLVRRDFAKITDIENVPPEWRPLFPTKFPWNGNEIQRVARFPDLFHKDDANVGLLNSGGDSKLIDAMRNALDMLVPGNVERIVIVSDTDSDPAASRFGTLVAALNKLNSDAVTEKSPGYPISIPISIGEFAGQGPSVAVFVFPNNQDPGTLEDILLECSTITHSEVSASTIEFISSLDRSLAAGHKSVEKMRKGSNINKSIMGSVANVLKPGSSLAVAIEQHSLVPGTDKAPEALINFDAFIDTCLR